MKKYITIVAFLLSVLIFFCGCTHNKSEIKEETIPQSIETDGSNYLCFTSEENNVSISFEKTGIPANSVNLEYSLDKDSWNNYIINEKIFLQNKNDKVYFRGNNEFINNNENNYFAHYHFSVDGKARCDGNIMSILDSSCQMNSIETGCCFYRLFADCGTLTSAPELPATSISDGCYKCMFYNCSSLMNAPMLPAKKAPNYCYFMMFAKCTSIKETPNLIADTLGEWCYGGMFEDCISLSNTSDLNATNLAPKCYSFMFHNCVMLYDAPYIASELNTDFATWIFKNTGITEYIFLN